MTRWPHGREFGRALDCPADAGDRLWQAWLDSHPSTTKILDPVNDVIVDVARTSRGDRRTYWVRSALIVYE